MRLSLSFSCVTSAVNAVQSVLNFEGMGCFAKPRNETDLEEAIISIPITAVTREETFEEPEALFCVVGQDAQVAVVFPLHTMCGSGTTMILL